MTFPMENQNNNSEGTTPKPAADGIRDLKDSRYYKLVTAEKFAEGLSLHQLVEMLGQANEQLHYNARNCWDDDDSERAYLAEAACVARAADIIRKLAEKGGSK